MRAIYALWALLLQVNKNTAAAWSNRTQQERFMRRAIELALSARVAGHDPYGAVIADPKHGVIVAEGANHASHDPIWHGEMAAIHNLSALSSQSVYDMASSLVCASCLCLCATHRSHASADLPLRLAREAACLMLTLAANACEQELYTTAEPCPMCMAAIEWAGFGAVFYGTSIPHIAAHGAAQINVRAAEVAARAPSPPFHNVSLFGGVLANETDPLYDGGHTHAAPTHTHGTRDSAVHAAALGERLRRAVSRPAVAPSIGLERGMADPHAPETTRILVAYHSETNRTASLARIICDEASAQPDVTVRCLPVRSVSCDDLTWSHGIALGSPVYWASVSASMKAFLDDVQKRCFGWPVSQMAWRAGAAFVTGAHIATGKETTLQALHAFFLGVQMVVVGNHQKAACELGACATNHNETAPVPTFTADERLDAQLLARRLVATAAAMRHVTPP